MPTRRRKELDDLTTDLPQGMALTWLGHSTFLYEIRGSRILVDPWLHDNPAYPHALGPPEGVDAVLVTHGHLDHMADAVEVARASAATIVASPALADWFQAGGYERAYGLDRGGYVDVAGVRVHMTAASHCSEFMHEGALVPGGAAAGFVLEAARDFNLYHAGDTDVFMDMTLIAKLYAPKVALLPIGGRFTMGPLGAAEAIRLLGVKVVVPLHWGTFDFLYGTPDDLRREASDVDGLVVFDMAPGDTLAARPPLGADGSG
jgi:L-ascorbate metabolism protein UlaG (beta-lactamase superfamily)